MREYAKKPESQSRTLDSNAKALKQASIADILQAYKNGTLGRQPVQRESMEDEELLQAKTSGQAPASAILQRYKQNIQRYASAEGAESLQGKFESALSDEYELVQREEKPNNTGLPDNLKTGIENLSGFSLDDVRVHYNSDKPAQLNAYAYAQGTNIHVAPGQEKHLPHEAWHVVQQKQGRVQPTRQLQGVNINDYEGLEREADMMGNIGSQNTISTSVNLLEKSYGYIGDIVQKVNWDNVDHERIIIEENGGGHYTAYYKYIIFDEDGDINDEENYQKEEAGELSLYEDNHNRQWINFIQVHDNYQKRGIGLSLLKKAVDDWEAIYAAVGMTNHDEINETDTRHLSVEGAALVSSALRNGILFDEWCFNPAQEVEMDNEDGMDLELTQDQIELSRYQIIQGFNRGDYNDAFVRAWIIANEGNLEDDLADFYRAADRQI